MFIYIGCVDQSLLIALVPHYSRFRLRGASARMTLKMALRMRVLFSVPTMNRTRHQQISLHGKI